MCIHRYQESISEVNEELLDAPESINEMPYDAWLVKVREITEKEELLTPRNMRRL